MCIDFDWCFPEEGYEVINDNCYNEGNDKDSLIDYELNYIIIFIPMHSLKFKGLIIIVLG